MTNIYAQHAAAFAQTEAHVILDAAGETVATIAFKFPRDSDGRLYAYAHWYGLEMVRGFAGGGGYDKRSAACAAAVRPMVKLCQEREPDKLLCDGLGDFLNALERDGSSTWDRALREAGFTVLQAV